jgi:hypothetical protein
MEVPLTPALPSDYFTASQTSTSVRDWPVPTKLNSSLDHVPISIPPSSQLTDITRLLTHAHSPTRGRTYILPFLHLPSPPKTLAYNQASTYTPPPRPTCSSGNSSRKYLVAVTQQSPTKSLFENETTPTHLLNHSSITPPFNPSTPIQHILASYQSSNSIKPLT